MEPYNDYNYLPLKIQRYAIYRPDPWNSTCNRNKTKGESTDTRQSCSMVLHIANTI